MKQQYSVYCEEEIHPQGLTLNKLHYKLLHNPTKSPDNDLERFPSFGQFSRSPEEGQRPRVEGFCCITEAHLCTNE